MNEDCSEIHVPERYNISVLAPEEVCFVYDIDDCGHGGKPIRNRPKANNNIQDCVIL